MLICKHCFLDAEMQSEVEANATSEGACDVCHKQGKVIDSSEFADFFEALLSLFERSDAGKPVAEMVQDEWHLFADNHVAEVLLDEALQSSSLGFSIKEKVAFAADIVERIGIWDRLKCSVMQKTRFFTNMDEFAQYNYLAKGKYNLGAGTTLYRSRITPQGVGCLTTEEMGCPPSDKATAGRANTLGIPYLYLSDSAKTTYYEVRAVYLDRLSVGTFTIPESLSLVDFCDVINLYHAYGDSVEPLKEIVIKKKVIDSISKDLSKPLRRYDSEIEYVPTQLICEFCKEYVHADGICFKSSLYPGGVNYVLFDPKAADCLSVESHEIGTIDIDR